MTYRLNVSFDALSAREVEALLAEADRRCYLTPKNANGSRARCFHALLQRRVAASRKGY